MCFGNVTNQQAKIRTCNYILVFDTTKLCTRKVISCFFVFKAY